MFEIWKCTLGYCAGSSGQLWKTVNVGTTWVSEITACTNNINFIFTFSNYVAYFGDNANRVYKNKHLSGTNTLTIGVQYEIIIYPNPADDRITVDLGNLKSKARSLKLMNVMGKFFSTNKLRRIWARVELTFQLNNYLQEFIYSR